MHKDARLGIHTGPMVWILDRFWCQLALLGVSHSSQRLFKPFLGALSGPSEQVWTFYSLVAAEQSNLIYIYSNHFGLQRIPGRPRC